MCMWFLLRGVNHDNIWKLNAVIVSIRSQCVSRTINFVGKQAICGKGILGAGVLAT